MPHKNCENCLHFNNEMHKNDKRTDFAGICNLFSETTFKTDTCRQFLDLLNAPTWEQITGEAPLLKNENITNQYNLEL